MAIVYVSMEISTDAKSFLRGCRGPPMFGMSPANAVGTSCFDCSMLYVELETESSVQHHFQIPNGRLWCDGALSHVESDVLHLLSARKEHSLCFVVSQFEAEWPHPLLHRFLAFSKNTLDLLQGWSFRGPQRPLSRLLVAAWSWAYHRTWYSTGKVLAPILVGLPHWFGSVSEPLLYHTQVVDFLGSF